MVMPEIDFTKLRFLEAIRFFRNKIAMTEDEFNRLSFTAKLRAFTISDMADKTLIQDIQEEILRALREGTAFNDFKKAFKEMLDRRGWAGPAPYRLETIFRANIQTAYEVGRYKQMTDRDVLSARPYWQYVAVMDSRTRPSHAALNGKIYPANHSFWDKWYPPNGFNCRCTVRTLSAGEVKREGLEVESRDLTGEKVRITDPFTEEKILVELFPDEGWDYNPGRLAT